MDVYACVGVCVYLYVNNYVFVIYTSVVDSLSPCLLYVSIFSCISLSFCVHPVNFAVTVIDYHTHCNCSIREYIDLCYLESVASCNK